MGRLIQIDSLNGDGRFDAYLAEPTGTPRAAIVVIQEVFGVNRGIRARCDRWASMGYVALAPDLFWRISRNIELDPDIPGQLQDGLDLFQKFDGQAAISDLEATIHVGKDLAGKCGVVGYCLGGRLAYLCATRTDSDASVGYYGVGINGLLGEAHAIARPLMLHFAEDDHFVDIEARNIIHEGLDDHAKVTIHEYPGVDHGFATESGNRRVEAAAQLADSRTEAFFAEHLG